ncbi:hypothetical protein [Chitinophaga cymbidii]|uniref:Uncharacterized protein n=1 Tax=Chitinophaga cymbidii TaxID=1096750 RepID=A0A512RFU0_9BACT|nr:hypothetical protein [Chitinophaga cymbidii]GEP94577.1 hypothetical protein CCY01nite_08370 [Chitinophaga cymbidii]
MSFSFGLFRFLTYGNIFVVGLFMLLMLMAMLVAPSMTSVVISLMISGVVLYHNILCLQLQRSTMEPSVPLKRNFPPLLIIVSVLSFIYSMFVFSTVIEMARLSSGEFAKMTMGGQMKQEEVTAEMLDTIRKTVLVLFGIHGLAIAANCVLSSVFLNKWKKERQEENDSFLDI